MCDTKVEQCNNVDIGRARVIPVRELPASERECDTNNSPQEQSDTSGNGESGESTNVRWGDERLFNLTTADIGHNQRTRDDSPEAGHGHVCVPEDGAHARAALLHEEIPAGGRRYKTGHEDELAALQGEAEVKRGEDAERDDELVLSEGESRQPGGREVGGLERGSDEDEDGEDVVAENALNKHSDLRDVLVVPLLEEGGGADVDAKETKEHFDDPTEEENEARGPAAGQDVVRGIGAYETDGALVDDED